MKENILLFIETGGPGGAERVVVELADEYRRQGHSVHVATLRRGWLTETLSEKNIDFSILKGGRTPDFMLVWQIVSLVRRRKITFLHSHLLDSNFYAAMAVLLSRMLGCRVRHIGTEHGDVHHPDGKKHVAFKLKTICILGSKLTAVSEFTRQAMITMGADPLRVSVVGNPIRRPFNLSDAELQEIRATRRAELGIPADEWVWIHVANIRPVKDQTTLVKGFALSVRNGGTRQRLIIVGDGGGRAALESLASAEGVVEKVMFLGFRNDVHELMTAADGFILTSKSEALPMSILEAGLAGLYVISSDVGGVGEVIKDGETGALFKMSDPIMLGERISTAIHSKDMASFVGQNLKRLVVDSFSPTAIHEKIFTFA